MTANEVLQELVGSDIRVLFLEEGFRGVRTGPERYDSSSDLLWTMFRHARTTGACVLVDRLLSQSTFDERRAIAFEQEVSGVSLNTWSGL